MSAQISPEFRAELLALQERWRQRAERFSAQAHSPGCRSSDIVRLTAMASTLEWAASEVALYTPTADSLAPMAELEDEPPQE
jgi:hypothetical protein